MGQAGSSVSPGTSGRLSSRDDVGSEVVFGGVVEGVGVAGGRLAQQDGGVGGSRSKVVAEVGESSRARIAAGPVAWVVDGLGADDGVRVAVADDLRRRRGWRRGRG